MMNNHVWQYMVYDAFGKLVAEYGIASEGAGGVKYLQQDHQGTVRAVTNSNGFVVSRTDHQAFGEEIGWSVGLRSIEQGYSADKVTRQSYGLTENDQATGQQHTWFRKLETAAGRWTRPDPYKGSMKLGNPQSFNRYSYVLNDPINLVDPSGLDFWDDVAAVAQGLGAAREALNSSLCRNFLRNSRGSGYRYWDPRTVFEAYISQGLIGVGSQFDDFGTTRNFRDGDVGAATTIGYTSSGRGITLGSGSISASQITINLNGFFFSLRTTRGVNVTSRPEFSGLTSAQVRGAVILHELAHAFGVIPPDGTSPTQSQANSETIKKMCFSPMARLFNDKEPTSIEPASGGIGTVITPSVPIAFGRGSYPSWYYSMMAFLDEVYSIEVGEGSVTVSACVGSDCNS
jgi:RHS repeat-associated protein